MEVFHKMMSPSPKSQVMFAEVFHKTMSLSPKSQVMFASAFSCILDFFVFLAFIVFYGMATLLNI